MFAWFDAREAKSFGSALAHDFRERMPLSNKPKDKKFEAKAKSALIELSTKIQSFQRTNKLNGYKKAQMANAFKWTLLEGGYDPKYVSELTEWLLLQF